MNVLVVGGSGFIGTNVSDALVKNGHTVTVLSRSPDAAQFNQRVQTVSGDVTEYETIEKAFEGQDTVINLVALSPLFKPEEGDKMHERVHLGGTKNIIGAAEEQGVTKLVQLSALGADPDGPTAYIRAKGQAEQTVQKADLNWIILRPSVVFGDGGEFISFTKMLTTPYVTGLPGGGKTRFQPLWIGDLVPIIVNAITQEQYLGSIFELGGPEVLTLADVTKQVYNAEGKPVVIIPVPMILAKMGLTISDALPILPMGTDQYRSLQFDNSVPDNDIGIFGTDIGDLTTLSEYLTLKGN